MRPTLLLLACVACDAADPAAPTPYVHEVEAPEETPVDAGVAAAGLQEALDHLATIDPEVFKAGYLAALSEFDDGGCPALSDLNGHARWIGDCVTQTGLEYHGDFIALNIDGFWMEDDYVDDFQRNFGQLNALFPSGEHVMFLGDTEVLKTSRRDNSTRAEAFANGDFYWSIGDLWLQEFFFVAMTWVGTTSPGGGWTVDLHGELGRLPGTVSAFAVESLSLSGTAGGCDSAPTGVLRGWTADSAQAVTLTLAGEGEGGCVACGPLEVEGEAAGSACVDLSAWGGAPW